MEHSSQMRAWHVQYEDPAGAQPDRREDMSEPRSSRPPSPSNRLDLSMTFTLQEVC